MLQKKVCQFCCGLPLFGQMGFICIDKGDRFDIAEGHTLRVPIAVVTFDRHPLLMVEEGLTEGAGDDAGSASDTEVFVNHHAMAIFRFPVASLRGTDFDAIGLLAMVAGHRKVKAYLLPLDHLDPGTTRIACSGMIDRTDHFALPAPGAFFLIN